jgi:hypothetical protein
VLASIFEASSSSADSPGTDHEILKYLQGGAFNPDARNARSNQAAQHKLIARKLLQNPEPILALAQRNLQRDVGHRLAPPNLSLAPVARYP